MHSDGQPIEILVIGEPGRRTPRVAGLFDPAVGVDREPASSERAGEECWHVRRPPRRNPGRYSAADAAHLAKAGEPGDQAAQCWADDPAAAVIDRTGGRAVAKRRASPRFAIRRVDLPGSEVSDEAEPGFAVAVRCLDVVALGDPPRTPERARASFGSSLESSLTPARGERCCRCSTGEVSRRWRSWRSCCRFRSSWVRRHRRCTRRRRRVQRRPGPVASSTRVVASMRSP